MYLFNSLLSFIIRAGDYEQGNYDESHEDQAEEPEDMRKKVLEMESELDKLTKMQMQVEKQITSASDSIDENSM